MRYTITQKMFGSEDEVFIITGAGGSELGTISGTRLGGLPDLVFKDSNGNRFAKIKRHAGSVSAPVVEVIAPHWEIKLEHRGTLTIHADAASTVYDGKQPLYHRGFKKLTRHEGGDTVAQIENDGSIFTLFKNASDVYELDIADGADTVAILSILVAQDLEDEIEKIGR